ncbi:MAG TPA: glycine cleavage T C-terminal barrel domain-containing protein [Candidatus Dormibacteraeota bacterium]|jgi:folate-binding protein YgfZ|nr:glycine cleavage T C-terminal barrel domain-containing protein [Candidatus Dormibacteraeota bacterium]
MATDAALGHSALQTPLLDAHRSSGANIGEWFGCALPSDFGDWRAEYQFARESVALLDKNYRAYLSFAGLDRVRYLNAILTNNIKDLKTGEGIVSLFLNPQGRIQAEIETYAEESKLLCVSFAMIREKLIPALDHFIIMDDVTLTDESARYGTLALEGPRAAEIVKQIAKIELGNLPEPGWKDSQVGSIPCRVIRRSSSGNPGAEFLCEQSYLPALWNLLLEAAKASGGGPAGYMALNALRLESGIPWFGYDFSEKQIPHEAGLENSHISYTKGCYTGQEIVERVRSRGQVNRVRALFQLSAPELPAAETPILFDGKEVGFITRAANSPAFQSNIAMGYVRREQSVLGSKLLICGADAVVIAPR